ncbi:Arf family GTPase [Starmerella bacillaris]|uniref:Arf family GTPase n=1 Tax=Starmerella bacillaris TaxID=1247836 RepID=A0AAV5RHD0_STABA|nr:Arf family GTPase [Starmerella bacillaris]
MVLLKVLRKQKIKESQARVLLLGLDNAGKSTLVAQILDEDMRSVAPTFGFQINTLTRDGINLHIWDIGGQQSLRPFWHNYFEKTDFLIWVVDACAPARLDKCIQELQTVLQQEDRLIGTGVLIWINKVDIGRENISLIEERLEKEVLGTLRENHNVGVIPCSAFTGEGINEGLDFVCDEIKSRLFVL